MAPGQVWPTAMLTVKGELVAGLMGVVLYCVVALRAVAPPGFVPTQ